MQSLCPSIPAETRPQLVPSPSNSPLSLESWCTADFEKWLCDSTTTLMRSNFNPSGSNRNPATVNRTSSNNNCVPHIAADESMLLSKISTYSNFVHVNIPSPSGSGPLAAESPTLYESANGFVGQPPPSYVRVKREREEEYSCQQITPSGVANIKRELGQGNTRVTVEDFDSTIKDVGNLAIEQVTNDICTACGVLGISSDPNDWSVDDVHAWLLWNVSQYGIKPDFVQKFHMDGVTLGSLSEDYFRQHIPNGGDILYAQLDIWKAAAHLQRSTSSNLESFHLEESMPDMSGILSQWSTPSPSAPAFHRMSPPAGSGGAAVIDMVTGSSPNPTNDFSSDGLQSDDEGSEESFDTEGRCSGGSRPGSHAHIHLWQFLKELLTQPQRYGSCIRWLDRPKGIFKIEDSVQVARLWGKRKNRPAMNYDKLSRSIRQYYKKGIMKKTERSQRLVYQFCHPYGL